MVMRSGRVISALFGAAVVLGNQIEATDAISGTPLILGCQAGFQAVGDRCMKVQRESPTVSCPPNTQKISRDCVSTGYYDPRELCPDGYHSRAECNCVKIVDVPPLVSCPLNYSLEAGNRSCVKLEPRVPIKTCPAGYKLSRIPEPAESQYASSESVICRKALYSKASLYCPELYQLRGDKCVLPWAPVSSCQPSIKRKRQPCVSTEVAATASCSIGQVHGTECVTYETAQVLLQCPGKGPRMEPDQVDCVVPTFREVIEGCELGDLTAVRGQGDMVYRFCRSELSLPSKFQCDDGDTLIGPRYMHRTPHSSLSPHYASFRRLLSSWSSHKNYAVARGSGLSRVQCMKKTYIQANSTCPPDSEVTFDGMCISREIKPLALVCPPGFELAHSNSNYTGTICLPKHSTWP